MTRVVILGEIFSADASIGGGPMPAPPGTGIWGGGNVPGVSPPIYYPGAPVDPGWGQGRPLPPHVGGGPIYPPAHVGGGPAYPPAWVGGGPAYPPGLHPGGGPIVLPPVVDNGPPVVVMPPIAPGHPPTVNPPLPPEPEGEPKPVDPAQGGWTYVPGVGWGYFPPQSEPKA